MAVAPQLNGMPNKVTKVSQTDIQPRHNFQGSTTLLFVITSVCFAVRQDEIGDANKGMTTTKWRCVFLNLSYPIPFCHKGVVVSDT